MPTQVRPFSRDDREQITTLINAHISAVVPNVSVSVPGLLSQIAREPGEFIVEPWVVERRTLVAEQSGRIVAAAHLVRYGRDEKVSADYRDVGEIRWLVCWPAATSWPEAAAAGEALASGCLSQLQRWGVSRCFADGSLPAPGVFGVPEQWPHIRALYEKAGFRHDGRTEAVFLALIADLPRPGPPPLADMTEVRTVGVNGTRFSAVVGGRVLGYIEVDISLDTADRMSRLSGWADVGNFHVEEANWHQGVGTWLMATAGEWLRMGGVDRLLGYASTEDTAYAAFLQQVGFRVLTRTIRGHVKP